MKKWKAILISLILLAIYILFINFLYEKPTSSQGESYKISSDRGFNVNMNMGTSASTIVKRNRWYGTIIEYGDTKSHLKLFDVIKTPLKLNGSSLIWYHIIVIFLLSFFVIINRDERRGKENEELGKIFNNSW